MHPLNRPYQQETYDQIINSKAKHIIIQAPTGSGKSAWAAQCAHDGNTTLVLTRTKSLQQQYKSNYDFTVLYGKSNYQCYNFQSTDFQSTEMIGHVRKCKYGKRSYADLCTVDKETYQQCCSLQCPYPLAVNDFLSSDFRSLNYSKYMLERKLTDGCDYLFLDEAHELSDIVTDYSGIVIPFSDRLKRYANPIEIDLPQPVAYSQGWQWLINLINSLGSNKPKHPNRGGDRREWRWHKRMTERVGITLNMMTLEPDCWFVFADDVKFTCKPLTARFHFSKLFDVPKIVMMSATIGKIDNFICELGIEDYEYIEVPNVWPAPLRTIRDLNAPKMTWQSDENDKRQHVELIAQAIQSCPQHWSGIIHTPSKKLAEYLALMLTWAVDRPVWTPSRNDSTEQHLSDWQQFYQHEKGAIGCSWSFWEGVDLGEQNINIIAKIPFINFADSYDQERFRFDRIAGLQRVANKIMQGLGRTRRGRESDYGHNGLVAIADGNWKRLRGYMSEDILEAIMYGDAKR
jgi:Rad3-related DNA helicase